MSRRPEPGPESAETGRTTAVPRLGLVGRIDGADARRDRDDGDPLRDTSHGGRGTGNVDGSGPDGRDDVLQHGDVGDTALEAALKAVLARKPARSPAIPRARSDDATHDAAPQMAHDRRLRFASALHQAPNDDGDRATDDALLVSSAALEPSRPLLDTAAWLAAARRKRLVDALRTASAWTLTVGVGIAIVAVTILALFAPTLELDAWIGFASQVL